MTASYVSARFEKTDLTSTGNGIRSIVRNLDDGGVPPVPNAGYRPTSPDALRPFLLLEYVNDAIGERYVRVCTLADLDTYTERALTCFEVVGADFVTAAVAPGDLLRLWPPNDALWASEEYPAAPFLFTVLSVDSPERLTLTAPIPSALANLSWEIAGKASGALNGRPRRVGFPAAGSLFKDTRFNRYHGSVAELDAYVAAVKAGIDALAAHSTSTTLSNESYSSPG